MYDEAGVTGKSHYELSSSIGSAPHVTFLVLIRTHQEQAVEGDPGFCEGLYSK